MIQLWVLPETLEEPAGYKKYEPELGQVTRIYGGNAQQDSTYAAKTEVSVALMKPGQEMQLDGEFMAYITQGSGIANNETVKGGDLFSDSSFHFVAKDNVHMIVVQESV